MFKSTLCLLLAGVGSLNAEKKVLAIAGSASHKSVNKQLLSEATSMARALGAEVTVIDLKDYPIPFYNADEEASCGMPQKAKELRQLMIQSDAIMIASPEYNASIPALLKNVIDWASRSPDAKFSNEAFQNKKFAIMSSAPGQGGGSRGLVHLRAILTALNGNVLAKQVTIPSGYTAFDADNHLKSAESKKELKEMVSQLLK